MALVVAKKVSGETRPSEKSGDKQQVVSTKCHRVGMRKVYKVNTTHDKLVLGWDVRLEDITQLSFLALVGKFGYRVMNKNDLGWWIKRTSCPW